MNAMNLPPHMNDGWDGVPSTSGGTPTPKRKFVAENADHLQGQDDPYLVQGVLPKEGVCILAAVSMAGKSFLALELSSSVAKGKRFLGKRTLLGGVAYVAAEAPNGNRTRIEGLRGQEGPWEGRFQFIGGGLNLREAEDIEALYACLLGVRVQMASGGADLRLVVIDTLSASIPGADENSAKDMSPVLTALQDLAARLGVCVLVVAHVGKDPERGLRGWSGMMANADGLISLSAPDDTGLRTGTVVKVKDGEAGQRFAFSLRQIELRQDSYGEPVTTCVVDWRDAPPAKASRQAAGPKLRPAMSQILTALNRLVDVQATSPIVPKGPVALGAPVGTRGVSMEQLQALAFEIGFHGVPPTEPGDQKKWLDARRKAFTNNLGYLVRDGFVRNEGGMVWRVDPPRPDA